MNDNRFMQPSGAIGRIAMLAFFLIPPTLEPQAPPTYPRVVPTIDTNDYHAVLQRIFPIPEDRGRDVVFRLTLRTTPAFDPESQIDIVLRRDQKSSVQFSSVDHNVYSTCNKLLEPTGDHNPDALASKISVTRKSLDVSPKQILRWQQDMLTGVGSGLAPLSRMAQRNFATGETVVVVDGTSFELWYAQEFTEVHLQFGDELNKSGLVTWARSLHQEVERLADARLAPPKPQN